MKKKIFTLVVVAVMGAYTAYNLNENDLNDVTLENVEALAYPEWGGTGCFTDSGFRHCNMWESHSHCYCGIW